MKNLLVGNGLNIQFDHTNYTIFESINSASLEECVYYYFNDSECEEIRALLPKLESQHILKMKSVKAFWGEMYED